MADNISPYPYLRKISSLPLIESTSEINLTDTLVLVQENTTKRATMNVLTDLLLQQVGEPKSAYELAKELGYIDINASLNEFFEWLRGGGLSRSELKIVAGNYQIVHGVFNEDDSGNMVFTRNENETSTIMEDEAFVIYQDESTSKYYTKHKDTQAYTEWDGFLDTITFISEIVGNPDVVPTYNSNMHVTDHFPTKNTEDGRVIDDVFDITDMEGSPVYEIDEEPPIGALVRLTYLDDPYGSLSFYDGSHFNKYNGIVDYVQKVTSGVFNLSAGSAARLTYHRDINIVTNITDDNITEVIPAKFDGSSDVEITISQLNAAVIRGEGEFTANKANYAGRLENPIKIDLSGGVTGSIINGAGEGNRTYLNNNVNISVSNIDASYITGQFDPDITVDTLTTPRQINVVSGESGDTVTNFTAASFDGSKNVQIVANAIKGTLISGPVASADYSSSTRVINGDASDYTIGLIGGQVDSTDSNVTNLVKVSPDLAHVKGNGALSVQSIDVAQNGINIKSKDSNNAVTAKIQLTYNSIYTNSAVVENHYGTANFHGTTAHNGATTFAGASTFNGAATFNSDVNVATNSNGNPGVRNIGTSSTASLYRNGDIWINV